MTYTQITITPTETRSREISEAKLIRLMSQVLIFKQAGEDSEWKCIYTPDYLHIVRYELIRRQRNGRTITTHFIPNGQPDLGDDE